MRIAVIDGQGGGIGKAVVEKLRAEFGDEISIIALGTNTIATSLMIRAGANDGATGENAVVINAARADIIIGSIAIISANSLLGELTPKMAEAIAGSDAKKVLLPLNRYSIYVAGLKDMPLLHYIDEAVEIIKSLM